MQMAVESENDAGFPKHNYSQLNCSCYSYPSKPRLQCFFRLHIYGISKWLHTTATARVKARCTYVCMCMCPLIPAASHIGITKERYQRILRNTGIVLNFADFPKNASFKSYGVICLPRAALAS